jgi:hypothetical membrane protein
LIGPFFIYRIHYRLPAILLMVGGTGTIEVGIFPETAGQIHIFFAFIAFLFIGILCDFLFCFLYGSI